MPSDDWWDEDDPFERIFKEMMKQFERMFGNIGKIEPGKPVVKGFSLTIGPDGKPVFREIGGGRTPGPISPKKKKIEAEIIDEKDKYMLVADLPGAEKDKIKMRIDDSKLIVKSEGRKKYYEVFKLPRDAANRIISYNYNNGVLSVEIEKKKGFRKMLGIE